MELADATAAGADQAADSKPPRSVLPVAFRRLLGNSLIDAFAATFLWFAVTFWVYIETKSVVATSILGGAYSMFAALAGMAFGTYVDRHRKRVSLVMAANLRLVCFVVAGTVYLAADNDDLTRFTSPWFWALTTFTLLGAVVGNLRAIVLSTCVSLLVPESERDRANGMIGTINGVAFTATSAASGLAVGQLGMGWVYLIAIVLTFGIRAHIEMIRFTEEDPERVAGADEPAVDIRGALVAIRAVPGLMLLVLLAAFNNLLGGVFMSLMDAYGLSLVSVEAWGLAFSVVSLGFILGGVLVAKYGLGRNPLRLIMVGNTMSWIVCCVFALRSNIILMTVGMLVWLTLLPVIEAAEQTVLQRTVPFETQGRVFGFAQMVENGAAPLTSFAIGPIAERVFMPLMSEGGGGADAIGSWFGIGPERGLALLFSLSGLIGLVLTVVSWRSRAYRRLAAVAGT